FPTNCKKKSSSGMNRFEVRIAFAQAENGTNLFWENCSLRSLDRDRVTQFGQFTYSLPKHCKLIAYLVICLRMPSKDSLFHYIRAVYKKLMSAQHLSISIWTCCKTRSFMASGKHWETKALPLMPLRLKMPILVRVVTANKDVHEAFSSKPRHWGISRLYR